MSIFILAACAVTFVMVAGTLLLHGRFGQRGLLWTSRMDDRQ